mmetsp:Transcript_8579/g.38950  ORF Transcript_8579/g.38950 Transcript_8579/m.38950 type:complete len:294 (-) Transcript_8579:65-946(-)
MVIKLGGAVARAGASSASRPRTIYAPPFPPQRVPPANERTLLGPLLGGDHALLLLLLLHLLPAKRLLHLRAETPDLLTQGHREREREHQRLLAAAKLLLAGFLPVANLVVVHHRGLRQPLAVQLVAPLLALGLGDDEGVVDPLEEENLGVGEVPVHPADVAQRDPVPESVAPHQRVAVDDAADVRLAEDVDGHRAAGKAGAVAVVPDVTADDLLALELHHSLVLPHGVGHLAGLQEVRLAARDVVFITGLGHFFTLFLCCEKLRLLRVARGDHAREVVAIETRRVDPRSGAGR